MASDDYRNFRLRGIPDRFQKPNQVRDLVRAALKLDEDTDIIVHSLARNPLEHCSRIATLTFRKVIPKVLELPQTEWSCAVPEYDEDEAEIWGPQRLEFDTHFRGFTPLHRVDDSECSTDLIAISGLGGHAFGSFKARGSSFMWLRDDLPIKLPQTRILLYGYDTKVLASSSFQNLNDLGNTFRYSIKRLQLSLSAPCQIRPTIFLGHSLGGLVIKEAIMKMNWSDKIEDGEFLDNIIAFMFFGVPHQGMATEHLFPMVGEQPNRSLIQSLGKHSAILQRYEEEFSEALKISEEPPEILSFYETEMSPTAKFCEEKQIWKCDESSLAVLVDKSSATNGCTSGYAIARNHSEMVKFTSERDEMYDIVLASLLPLLDKDRLTPKPLSASQRDCLKSLFFNEQNFRQAEILDGENTCAWLLDDPHYRHWIRQPRGLLCVKGKPGAGKSVLMKYASEKLREKSSGSRELVGSFYIHGRGVNLQKRAIGVYRALLYDLLPHFDDMLSEATVSFAERESRYGSHREGRWEWSEQEVEKLFLQLLLRTSTKRRIVIFIDALDECEKDSHNKLLASLKRFRERIDQENSYAKICFSSRHYPTLGKATFPIIVVENGNREDIRQVMEEKLQDIESEAERQRIVEVILSKENGVFQWAVLVADKAVKKYLKGFNIRGIEREIEILPAELDSLYAGLLNEVNEDEAEKAQTIKLFRWVLFACRPLSVRELREALATDSCVSYTTISNLREHDDYAKSADRFERRVIDMSKGLIQFKARDGYKSLGPKDEGSDCQAEFIHQSVSEYLLECFLKPAEAINGTPYSSVGCGHFELSRSCLRYLVMDEICNASKLPRMEISIRYPLVEYATRYLFTHIQRAESEEVDQSDLADLLRWGNKTRDDMARLRRLFDPQSSYSPIDWPFYGGNIFHILAALGSMSALRAMLRHDNIEIDCKDSFNNTPLLVAIREGHHEIAQELLRSFINWLHRHSKATGTQMSGISLQTSAQGYFVDVNAENDNFDTPMTLAVSSGASRVVYGLIEASPLLHSIRTNDKVLLIKIIEDNVNLDGAVYYAVARMASVNGVDTEELIRLLLEAGASTQSTSHLVSYTRKELNDNDKDSKLQSGSVMLIAAHMENLSLLQLLLTRGSHTPKDVCNAWEHAVSRNKLPMVELFLVHMATMSCPPEIRYVLEVVVTSGNEAMTEMILDNTTDMNRPDSGVHDLFVAAVKSGRLSMVELLLNHRAMAKNLKQKDLYGALTTAVVGNNASMVKLFLNHGVDINATDEEYSISATRTFASILGLDIPTIEPHSPLKANHNKGKLLSEILLYYALEKHYFEVFQLLLSQKASLDSKQAVSSANPRNVPHPFLVELLTVKRASMTGIDINLRNALGEARLHRNKNTINSVIQLIAAVHYGGNLIWPPEYPNEHEIAQILASNEVEDASGVLVGIVRKAVVRGNENLVEFMLGYVWALALTPIQN